MKVNRMLNRAVVFSIFWVAGLGSFYSVWLATQALLIILRSNGEVQGLVRVIWCYVVGGLGVLLISSILLNVLLNG